jgi:DNA-3-methyladenine glycosylase II
MKKALEHLRAADPVMAGIIGRVGRFRMEYRDPDFDTLVRSIVYQQLSGKAAATIYGRLSAAAGSRGVTPAAILRLGEEKLRALGLSNGKTSFLLDLARKTRSRQVRFEALPAMSDEEVIAHLTAVKGIGVWTAQMFLMFGLRRRDVFPLQDLGIRNAIQREYGLAASPKPDEMLTIAAAWRPYSSVASWYLWRSLDGPAAL